jgi:bifunctional UDP-N-acetylglucosamine pyrophosphorylase/glucosamine-1-phosphate N-acetyltransferase
MLDYVIRAALGAGARDAVVVVGCERDAVVAHLASTFPTAVRTAVQEPQRGTGDAVRCAMPVLGRECDVVLVLYGDTPLLEHPVLERLLAARAEHDAALAMLTCMLDDPAGYGRIVRDERGAVARVREQVDASETERAIREVNPGMYAVRADFLRSALETLRADNAQRELYLTDIVALAAAHGTVAWVEAPAEALGGINDRCQLARAEESMHRRIADGWRRAGVTVRGQASIDADVELAPDALVDHGAVLRGRTRVGARARIGIGAVLEDVDVAEDAVVKPYSVCVQSTIGPRAQVGPFAHLRPESRLDADAHLGNFVEAKKTHLARGAKANHLAYLGDGEVGEEANVGAGTIFCNYDGFRKHRTVIGPRAFIGSDSQLVAPVTVGAGAYVATGTTVTKDVPPDALAIARPRQENKEGYAPRLRAKLAAQPNKP